MNTTIQIIALAHFGSLLCRFLVLYFFEVSGKSKKKDRAGGQKYVKQIRPRTPLPCRAFHKKIFIHK